MQYPGMSIMPAIPTTPVVAIQTQYAGVQGIHASPIPSNVVMGGFIQGVPQASTYVTSGAVDPLSRSQTLVIRQGNPNEQCICGSFFLPDSNYCRICGVIRPSVEQWQMQTGQIRQPKSIALIGSMRTTDIARAQYAEEMKVE